MASSIDMQQVVLDANALLMPFEFSINIDYELQRLLGECEVIVPAPIIGELRRSRSKHSRAALALARKYKVSETKGMGDEAVLELAVRLGAYVLTNDQPLRARLRRRGIRTIFLRSGKYLDFD